MVSLMMYPKQLPLPKMKIATPATLLIIQVEMQPVKHSIEIPPSLCVISQ